MALKANYFKIGIFVVAAIIVLIGFTIVLGLGAFGSEQIRFETYIDESVQGLLVGSPVKRRGVQIGSVERITFLANEYELGDKRREYSRYVMVVIVSNAKDFANACCDEQSFYNLLDELIIDGLRIRLTTQPLTGIAYLDVDYFDPEQHPMLQPPWKPKFKYIPSTTSMLNTFAQSLEQTIRKVEEVPFIEITQRLNTLLDNLNTTIENTRVTEISERTLVLLAELHETNTDLRDVIADAKVAIEQANVEALSEQTQQLIATIDGSVTQITDFVQTDVGELLGNIDKTNSLVQNLLEDSSPERTTIPALTSSIDGLVTQIQVVINENRDDLHSVAGKLERISDNLLDFSQTLKQDPGAAIFSAPPKASEVVK